jgi:hypothetical protein
VEARGLEAPCQAVDVGYAEFDLGLNSHGNRQV